MTTNVYSYSDNKMYNAYYYVSTHYWQGDDLADLEGDQYDNLIDALDNYTARCEELMYADTTQEDIELRLIIVDDNDTLIGETALMSLTKQRYN